jgi:NRE family putative nickel resistance protein-like MFS transporter
LLQRPVHRVAEIFSVLANPELRALWFADWISDVGNFVTFIALAVYVHALTGSSTAVGVALALGAVPRLLFGPVGGIVADRLDRRRVMIGCNLARAGIVAVLPFTTTVWQAYALASASAAFSPVHRPARSALLAQIAPEGRLVRALAVTETTHEVLHTVGPAIAGLVIFLVGARHAFFVDAASFVLAAVFQARIRSRGRPERVAGSSSWRDLKAGYLTVLRHPAVRTYTLLSACSALVYGAVIVLLLLYIQNVLHQAAGLYGIVLSVAGAGTVLMSLLVAARDAHQTRAVWAVTTVFGLAGFGLIALGPSLPLLFVIAAVASTADTAAGIPESATIAEAMPDDLRGRVYGATDSVWDLMPAIGSLAAGWLAGPTRLGIRTTFAFAAGVGVVLAIAVLAMGGLSAITSFERKRLSEIAAGS